MTKALYILLFFFFYTDVIFASHIAGGDMHYECLGAGSSPNTNIFKITLIQYYKCDETPNDQSVFLTLWHGIEGELVSISLDTVYIIDNPTYLCFDLPPGICLSKKVFQSEFELSISDTSYVLTYNECCRTADIISIFNPIAAALSFDIEISPEAQNLCNSSPTFQDLPPTAMCVGTYFEFPQVAIDPEGDQLVYELCAVQDYLNGTNGFIPPYGSVNYLLPTYNALNPLGPNAISLEPNIGTLSGTPLIVGQFVLGICVSEYRNGQFLSVIRRDIQLNVVPCIALVDVELEGELSNNSYTINSCEPSVTFPNTSTQQSSINNLLWTFTKDNYTDTSTAWSPTIFFPEGGTYNGTLVLNPDGECSDTANIIVNIVADIAADFDFTYDTCIGGPVQFINHSYADGSTLTNWHWDFGDGSFSYEEAPLQHFANPGSFEVQLKSSDEFHCSDSVIKSIEWLPAPEVIIISPDFSEGCAPLEVTLTNLSWPIDTSYAISWDFGDGVGESQLISPAYIYESEGIYSISIAVVSPIGCRVDTTFTDLISISGAPTAAFDFAPEELSIFNNNFTITNHSENVAFWNWQLDERTASLEWEPMHLFEEVGSHSIRLVVSDSYGCVDTLVKSITVHPESTFHLPSAFTPNGDGLNDYFRGTGMVNYISDFQLSVWDRWGQLVFKTDDPMTEWNGQFQNTGKALANGVYICKVSFVAARGAEQEVKGFVSLIR